ncbi:MAG: alpha/beta hydrolase-fold protein [Saprospiraceae bacterium]
MLRLKLHTPADDDRPVYVCGNFNEWKTTDARYRMERIGEGEYELDFDPEVDTLEYKYTKGGWESEELDSDGHPPVNRFMEQAQGTVRDVVPRWKSHSGGYNPEFYPDIRIVAKHFHLPQLNKRRRISVLLPWNYDETNKHYPVLYLQDGQNLFEEDAPFGTWGVDKQLAKLAEKGLGDFIVVAIDHGGKERIKEYSPYNLPKWGEGLGEKYTRFLAETLKPYIDSHFRTLTDRENTGIGGSSMGGLISIYAGVLFPETYSRFLVFSPSLWASPRLFFEPMHFAQFPRTRIYLYGGGREGASVINNLKRFKKEIEKRGLRSDCADIHLEMDPEGEHNEARWGEEFPKAIDWLWADEQIRSN